jgi:hypothetical protein
MIYCSHLRDSTYCSLHIRVRYEIRLILGGGKMSRAALFSLTVALFTASMPVAGHADQFVNGAFEDGTLNGWTQGGGFWFGGPYPAPVDYLPGGANFDSSGMVNSVVSQGFDPRTDNVLRTVYAGNHSAKVNNELNNDSVSVISQRVNNYTDPLIAFAYAAVLQDSHGPTDSDAFIVSLEDVTTNETIFTYNLNSATAPGVFTESTSGWFYSDWLTQSIDVSAREGHDFILSLLANDCPYGGHAGYAYLDGFGGVVPPPTGGTPEPSTWFMMLAGFGGMGFIAYRKRGTKMTLSAG